MVSLGPPLCCSLNLGFSSIPHHFLTELLSYHAYWSLPSHPSHSPQCFWDQRSQDRDVSIPCPPLPQLPLLRAYLLCTALWIKAECPNWAHEVFQGESLLSVHSFLLQLLPLLPLPFILRHTEQHEVLG